MSESELLRSQPSDPRVESGWEALLERVLPSAGPPGTPLALHVLGGVDAGKTTLCRWLGEELAGRGHKVALVDCDPGQGSVGPPTMVGLAWARSTGAVPSALRFVGDVSPTGHFLQLTVGIGALARQARKRGAEAVIFDSSGFMDTEAGREYHTLLVEATVAGQHGSDDTFRGHLVALQKGDELRSVLRAFDGRADVEVHRLDVSSAVGPRSREERRRSRAARLRRHFAEAGTVSLSLAGRGVQGRVPSLAPGRELEGLLVALLDQEGSAVGPFILLEVEEHEDERILHLRGPAFDPAGITSIQFGTLRIQFEGLRSDERE